MLTAVTVMIGLAAFFAAILALANQRFKTEEDPKVEELARELPGLNCGACGFPSCREFAKALVGGDEEAAHSTCRAASPRALDIILKIAPTADKASGKTAVVFCGARDKDKTKKAVYKGIATCRSANIVSDGGMSCRYGCLGFGDCERACPFGAVRMVRGLPEIDRDKCTGCGKCVSACPRGIIELMPRDTGDLAIPACRSEDKGVFVRKICPVGCIACRLCERLSGGVFFVENNLAKLDMSRLEEKINWDEIINKCPTRTIVRV